MGHGRGKSAGRSLVEVEDVLSGMILLWSGAIVDIPAGYVLCDGNNGSPDLRDKFIRGAGNIANPDQTGGSTAHSHTFTGDGHSHTIGVIGGISAGPDNSDFTSTDPAAGTTDSATLLPPWYALAFIMKT